MDGGRASEIDGRIGRAAARLWGAARAHPLIAAIVATTLVSGLALAFPRLDVAVAGLFYRDGGGFPAERTASLMALRSAGMAVTRIAIVALVLAGLAKLLLPMLMRGVSSRKLMFLAASLMLGPGILVNSILKEFWGRPRPRQIVDFGGAMEFFPAWVPGGGCASNCSFPSGEASSAFWLVALAVVVPVAWRRATLLAALAWALVISLNRMAFGGHFLSDVLIAWGLMAIVVLAARAVFLEKIGPLTEARIDEGLARTGERLLALVRRPVG